jgi:outer membrane protein OmpA-like peptidoglycan-associated protein
VSTSSPGRLRFQARCLKDALDPNPIKTLELGVVTGQVGLGKLGQPAFTIESTPEEEHTPLLVGPSSVAFRRSIALGFRSPEFHNRPERPVRLLIADGDLVGVRHLELVVTLEVGGSVEADATLNDVLDIPLKLEFLALNVVDEVGEPLKSQAVALDYAGGEHVELTTDAKGQVRVQNPPGGASGLLTFPAAEALRAELEQRWSKVRNKPRLRANRAVTVVSVTEQLREEVAVTPGVRTVSLQPRVELARFVGLFFETSKSFLLPSARAHLGQLQALYDAHPNSTLLVVGHADRAGSTDYNDRLALERAEAIASYLKDEIAGFTKFYGASVSQEKRWGDREDRLMLRALKDGADLFAAGDPVQAFRSSRSLTETGPTGPATRDALVAEYMASDEAKLPEGIELVTHGCGEHFPEVPTADGAAEEENRRVELFFFDTGFGVQPKPPGKSSKAGSTAYPEWRRRAQQTHEFDLRLGDTRLLRLTLLDGEHRALAGMDFTILHDFGSEIGQTDAKGALIARIPSRVKSAVLVHDLGSLDLDIIELPAVEEVLGTQLRLCNLAYTCPTDGALGAETQAALQTFQQDNELEASGAMDAPTLTRLKDVYGQ